MTITMDGVPYRLRVKLGTLGRSFRIEESERSGMVVAPLTGSVD